jgi:hypothetical protein
MKYALAWILFLLSLPAAVVFGDMLGVIFLLMGIFLLADMSVCLLEDNRS